MKQKRYMITYHLINSRKGDYILQIKNLFMPIKLGMIEINNRFVIPAIGPNSNPDSTVSLNLIDFWQARAKGGWGLLIVASGTVDPIGKSIPMQLGLWDNKFIPGYRKLTDIVHKYGVKIAIQLHHAGRQTNSKIIGAQPVAPSAISCPVEKELPRELSTSDIYEIIDKYGDAAVRAQEAGFDAIEIHGAHGYLVAQFMSLYSNKRIDEFGGNFLNRMRFPVEIIKNIRHKVDTSFPIIFRFSGNEKVIGGRSLSESKVIANLIQETGVNAVHISVGVYAKKQYIIAPGDVPPGFLLKDAGEVKQSITIPVIAVGRIIDPWIAEDAIKSGRADLIAWGRQSLVEPELPKKIAAENFTEIAPCIGCMQGCLGYLYNPKKMKVTCLVNPFCGEEGKINITPVKKSKKVIVVGGGPGGLETAWLSSARGHKVILFEKQPSYGGQFRLCAALPGKQDFSKAIGYLVKMCEKYNVSLNINTEATIQSILTEKPDVVVLATGARWLIPNMKGVNEAIITVPDILNGQKQVGTNVLVVGGGSVGCGVADYLGERGHKITIVEKRNQIGIDIENAVNIFLQERLTKYNVKIETESEVIEFLKDGVIVKNNNKNIHITGFDNIVLAIGVKSYQIFSETLKNHLTELYIIGDAVLPRKAIDAIHEGACIATQL